MNVAIKPRAEQVTCYAEAEQGRGTQESPQWQYTINVVYGRLLGDCHVGHDPPADSRRTRV